MNSIIDDLQDPASHPDRTEKVSVVQTHISVVFVADEFVYKVKKPVDFGFLDFSTLEKRKYYCHREVELNRRLSEGVYLDVLPVFFRGGRHSLWGGPEKAVEYAVKMKRIPDQSLMRSIFEADGLTKDHLERVAKLLAEFHLNTLRSPEIDEFGEPERFRVNTDENFEQIEKYIGLTVEEKVFSALKRWTEAFYEENKALFYERIRQGRIRDCHGDLHMEHICLTEPPSIIDCIEFNDRFRYSDTIADIAFLLMDLEYNGGASFSAALWDSYRDLAKEGEVASLLMFYKVYRAIVRGKVIGFKVDDEAIGAVEKDEAVQTARSYFDLAYSYIEN